jgi:hypothetical protein
VVRFLATTALDEARLGYSDEQQLAFAVAHHRTLLTHNRRDFEALANRYYAAEKSHFGIIIARRHSVYQIARRLLLLLDHVTADEIRNQMRYI